MLSRRVFFAQPALLIRSIRSISSVKVNQVEYNVSFPEASGPLVVVSLAGNNQQYMREAMGEGFMPATKHILERAESTGSMGLVACAMPSYSFNNNLSMITGKQANEHGVVGATYMDSKERRVRQSSVGDVAPHVESILGKLEESNLVDVKLLCEGQALGDFLASLSGIHNAATSLVSGEVNHGLIFKEAIDIIGNSNNNKPQLVYVATSDYIHHRYRPFESMSKDFYRQFDDFVKQVDDMGGTLIMTSPHGMNDKIDYNDNINLLDLETYLQENHNIHTKVHTSTDVDRFGESSSNNTCWHSGLGSFASIYVDNAQHVPQILDVLRNEVSGLSAVLSRDYACNAFSLPSDKVGDIVVIGDEDTLIASHDDVVRFQNSKYKDNIQRSHGGVEETTVTMFVNRPLHPPYKKKLGTGKARTFEIFDFLFNGIQR